MKTLLKLEELAVFMLCVVLFAQLQYAWWLFLALLFLPDISMLGYLINARIGAYLYNVAHHRLIAAAAAVYAIYSHSSTWQLVAIVLFAHISMDRFFGYGLKHEDAFQHTHLGVIGKGRE